MGLGPMEGDTANPNKPQIERQITVLENRLTQLRHAIGQ